MVSPAAAVVVGTASSPESELRFCIGVAVVSADTIVVVHTELHFQISSP